MMSKIPNSGRQRPKNRKNETRKMLKIQGLDFLSYDFLSYVSTVYVFLLNYLAVIRSKNLDQDL